MHLVNYEESKGDLEKGLAAIEVSKRKNAKSKAWAWAEIAVEHAEGCGVKDAINLLGSGRYPETNELEKVLQAIKALKA